MDRFVVRGKLPLILEEELRCSSPSEAAIVSISGCRGKHASDSQGRKRGVHGSGSGRLGTMTRELCGRLAEHDRRMGILRFISSVDQVVNVQNSLLWSSPSAIEGLDLWVDPEVAVWGSNPTAPRGHRGGGDGSFRFDYVREEPFGAGSGAGGTDTAAVGGIPSVLDMAFDSKGVYLAVGNSKGVLSVHDFDILRVHRPRCLYNAAILVGTNEKLESVKWNPFNQNEVACGCSGRGSQGVHIFDLGVRGTEIPKQSLRVSKSIHPTEVGKHGILDIAVCQLWEGRVVGTGKNGKVFVWDRRRGNLPCAMMGGVHASMGAVNAIELSNDEQVVYGGSEGGNIYTWDLRVGGCNRSDPSSSCAFSGAGDVRANLPLHVTPLDELFRAMRMASRGRERGETVPLSSSSSLLTHEGDFEPSAVHALALDPSDGCRLAFHLNNGWSGVLDTGGMRRILHADCPPPPWAFGSDLLNAVKSSRFRRRPAWLRGLSVYCTPSAIDGSVEFLDFSRRALLPRSRGGGGGDEGGHGYFGVAAGKSGGAARAVSERSGEKGWEQARQPVNSLAVKGASVVASHPTQDCLVVGTTKDTLLVVALPNRSL